MYCPSIHYDDNRGSLLSLVLVVLASLSMLAVLLFLAHLSVVQERKVEESLQALSTQDPRESARTAIRGGDLRYLAIPAPRTGSEQTWTERVSIPGVGEFDMDEPGHPDYRCIPGITAVQINREEKQHYQQAEAFAEAYNQTLAEERTSQHTGVISPQAR